MRAREALDAFLGEHAVERAAGAAIGIGAEDRAAERGGAPRSCGGPHRG